MRINLYDADSGEQVATGIDLAECFDGTQDNPEYDFALDALTEIGEYFVGGGAAPAWHMKRVDD